jgi:hypothetical protein
MSLVCITRLSMRRWRGFSFRSSCALFKVGTVILVLVFVCNHSAQGQCRNPWSTKFIDVTGDHRADAIAINNGGITVRRAQSANTNANGLPFMANELWANGSFLPAPGIPTDISFADVNGDGKADAISVKSDGIRVRLADPNQSSFVNEKEWTVDAFSGSRGTFFADVTGDGKADAIAVNDNGIWVRPSFSNGQKYFEFPAKKWTDIGFWGQRIDPNTNLFNYFADVTGDGAADAITVNDDGIYVRRALPQVQTFGLIPLPTGGGVPLVEKWTEVAFFGDQGTYFADVNGDGKADAIAVKDDGIYVRLANQSGSGFDPADKWTLERYFGSRGTYFADVNGDGKADAIAVNEDRVTVRFSEWPVKTFGGNVPATEIGFYGNYNPICF